MKVREVVSKLRLVKELHICYGGYAWVFDHQSSFMLDAFGDYEVAAITSVESQCFEIEVASKPIKHINQAG